MNFDENNPLPPEPPEPADPVPQSLEAIPPADSASRVAGETGMAALTGDLPDRVRPSFPEDLRAPWGWLDLLLLAALAVGATFLLGMLLVTAFGAFGVSRGQLQSSASAKSFLVILNQVLLSFALLGYLAAQMRLRFDSPFWRTIGWRPLETSRTPRGFAYLGFLAGGFPLAIVIQLASNALGTKAKLPIQVFFQDRRSAVLLMLIGVLLAPIVEETIFRGYIYPVIARTFGVAASVIFTGTLFGLLHAPQLWGGWGQIALLVAVGVIFTYVRAVTRTVVASYLLHLSYNSCLFVAFLVASHGLHRFPAGS